MIHGATIPRASWKRIAAETRTRVPSQTGTGTSRASGTGRSQGRVEAVAALLGNAHLAQPLGDLGRERVVGLDADVGGRAGHLAEHLLAHDWAAGRLLERGRVEVGDVAELVLGLGVAACGRSHPG